MYFILLKCIVVLTQRVTSRMHFRAYTSPDSLYSRLSCSCYWEQIVTESLLINQEPIVIESFLINQEQIVTESLLINQEPIVIESLLSSQHSSTAMSLFECNFSGVVKLACQLSKMTMSKQQNKHLLFYFCILTRPLVPVVGLWLVPITLTFLSILKNSNGF